MVVAQAREIERGRTLLSGVVLAEERGTAHARPQRATSVDSELARFCSQYRVSPALALIYLCFAIAVAAGFGPLWGVIAFGLCIAVSILKAKRETAQQSQAFERDYPALLLALASAVRTGLDPLMALLATSELFEENSVMRKELQRVKSALERGATEEEAIHHFGTSVRHPDLQLFRTAFVLARKEGASLSECLRRLVRVTRNRQSFRRKVKAAVALQKLSAIGIGGCAIAIGIIQGISNPQAMEIALSHPSGSKLIFAGLFAIVLGIAWMLRISGSHR
ncbi:MAG: type II secretion system F family protein [Bdellovibrionota bacterium]|nr:MAG: type II secretion system F family protein [Bdellovibrionota bacterium]